MTGRAYAEGVWERAPEGVQPPLAQLRLRFLLGLLAPGQRVLDLGCGEGWCAAALSQAGFDVVGVDVAKEPLRRARRRHADLDLREIGAGGGLAEAGGGLAGADGGWPLTDASFDAVWAGEVIEHVADTAAWLSEVRRVLRPHGTLALSTPAHDRLTRLRLALRRGAFEAHYDPRADHLRFYTRRSLRELLQDFRFEQVRICGAGGLPGARATMLASARRARF
jgi:2-polyprenyl-3-methyl-5-hydroxy-6-metoxy-1,4-benzoquinol methylase